MEVYHEFLIDGNQFAMCRRRVLRFFDLYELIAARNVEVLEQRSIPGTDPTFWPRMDQGQRENKAVLREFIEELKGVGLETMDDLQGLSQGYRSKILHTIAHLLDGFFGIDSYLYNLVEDSHWVSEDLRRSILADPQGYWLITVEATYAQEGRSFEKKVHPGYSGD